MRTPAQRLRDAALGRWYRPTPFEALHVCGARLRPFNKDLLLMAITNLPSDEHVTITKRELQRLRQRDAWLQCLEAAGVDNWDGFEHAQEIYADIEEDLNLTEQEISDA